MKKHILIFLLNLPVVGIISCPIPNKKTEQYTSDSTIAKSLSKPMASCVNDGELALNLTNHVLKTDSLKKEFDDFYNTFSVKSPGHFTKLIESVRFDNFLRVISSVPQSEQTTYIRGVWVAFTLNARFELKYYFIPLTAKFESQQVNTQEFKLLHSTRDTSLVEILDNGLLKVFEIDDNNLLINTSNDNDLINEAKENWVRYENEIYVSINQVRRPYSNTINDGDSRLVYFPIQELCDLYGDNNNQQNGSTIPNNEFLHIFPSGKLDINSQSVKHSVNLFSSNSNIQTPIIIIRNKLNASNANLFDKYSTSDLYKKSQIYQDVINFTLLNFQGKAANFGQLCPTKCGYIRVLNRQIIH